MRIDGNAALVSGGASGLGEATARVLVANGAACTILDRDAERGGALAKELGGATSFMAADVTDPTQVGQAVDHAAQTGPLRIAVNCAGIGSAMRLVDRNGAPHDLDAFRLVVNVNLIGTFNVMRLAAAAIVKTDALDDDERGVIVNTASVAAFEGQIGQIAYSASKGGIVGMTVPAARDLAPSGIRVLTIAPGVMDTPLLGLLPDEGRQALAAGVPFPKRLGTPDDFAALVVHLCQNRYLNAEVIRLDGGLRMQPR
jgi:NAD(P)-dependent dehydrogenase (short-subunit alcohol dehydrogenase family)